MKTFKIEIPKGYEIDKEKSNFENIVFKEVKKELPKTWEELGKISGYYVKGYSEIEKSLDTSTDKIHQNVFETKDQAEASIALAMLSQLREVYRDGWKADCEDEDQKKYCIEFRENKIEVGCYYTTSIFLSFQSPEIRDLFLENFRELIEKAKPLMS